MTQKVKAPAAKPSDLSLIPGAHMVLGETQLSYVVLSSTHAQRHTSHIHSCALTHRTGRNVKQFLTIHTSRTKAPSGSHTPQAGTGTQYTLPQMPATWVLHTTGLGVKKEMTIC